MDDLRVSRWSLLLAIHLVTVGCADDAAGVDGGDAGRRLDASGDVGLSGTDSGSDAGTAVEDARTPDRDAAEWSAEVVLDENLAFPTVMGFGRGATGGEGGRIIRVTNLDDSGEGSFRAAVEASGARVVHFDVAGNIVLRSRIFVTNGDLTIAGETAPGDGVALVSSGDESSFNGSLMTLVGDNIVVRFIRLRRLGEELGSNTGGGGILGRADGTAHDYVYDHVTWSWMSDDLTGAAFRGATGITYQNCMFYESLRKTGQEWHGGKGSLFYGNLGDISLIQNLWANLPQRNPSVSTYTRDARLEHVNNLVYNRAFQGLTLAVREGGETTGRPATGTLQANVLGNHYIPGADTFVSSERYSMFASTARVLVYVDDNLTQQRTEHSQPQWDCMGSGPNGDDPAPTSLQNVTPFEMTIDPGDVLPVDEVEAHVLANAGANISRDAADARIVREISDRTARIIREAYPIDREYPILEGDPWTYAPGTHIPVDFATAHGVVSDDEVRDEWVLGGVRVVNTVGATAYQIWRWHRAGDFAARARVAR
ncbi:MAG: hypothetical protein M3Q72_02760 [Actinomycetota bacterium]|nr:hypothetical protein [Myxococcota bacterium]MDQ3176453.1 hypothetical protein [Actinomycetota bacterium]